MYSESSRMLFTHVKTSSLTNYKPLVAPNRPVPDDKIDDTYVQNPNTKSLKRFLFRQLRPGASRVNPEPICKPRDEKRRKFMASRKMPGPRIPRDRGHRLEGTWAEYFAVALPELGFRM